MEIETQFSKIYKPIQFIKGETIENIKKNIKSVDGQKEKKQKELQIHLRMVLDKHLKIGPGFRNLGNTCFMNSALQCLTYTPPMVDLFLNHYDLLKIDQTPKNLFQECVKSLKHHYQACFLGQHRIYSPTFFAQNLRLFGKKFKLGKQEDSHEFIRNFIDALQKALVGDKERIDLKLYESTIFFNIFGGKLKSQLKCMPSQHKSEIFEQFYDLNLDISGNSIQKSLEQFFKIDTLSGNNKYRCEKCKTKVDAQKRFLIHQIPNILTLHLKRFNNFGQKIMKHVEFSETINLTPFLDDEKASAVYDLYAVLVHLGSSMSSGHYYCYIKGPNNMWFRMDDEQVSLVSLEKIKREQCYLLFYKLITPETSAVPNKSSHHLNSQNISTGKVITQEASNTSIKNHVEQQEYLKKIDINGKNVTNPKKSANENGFITALKTLNISMNEKNLKENTNIFKENAPTGALNSLNKFANEKKDKSISSSSNIQPFPLNVKQEHPIVKVSAQPSTSSNNLAEEKRFESDNIAKVRLPSLVSSKFRRLKTIISFISRAKKKSKTSKGLQRNNLNFSTDENDIPDIGNYSDSGDDTEKEELLQKRNKFLEKNKDDFNTKLKVKDEYDLEYDKGKQKKVRKDSEKKILSANLKNEFDYLQKNRPSY